MKPLLLLLLLTSWTHLGSEARICDTNMAINGHLVSIDGSRMAGADAYFLKAYPSEKLKSCLEDCCSAKFGECSVAAYKNTTESTCLHFFCKPLSKCKFFPTNFADSFVFPDSVTSTPTSNLKELVAPMTNVIKLLKDHERSVAARKGVENIPLTRKGVDLTTEEHILDGELTFKDDNTTIKPRKGVDFFSYILTTPLSNISVIKPRKGVDMNKVDISNTRSKIKPRKGVEPFTPTSTSIMPSSSFNFFTDTASILQHDIHLHTNSEMISLLEDIFSDDMNTTAPTTKVPKISSTPTLNAQAPSSTALTSAALHTHDQYLSAFPTTPKPSHSSSTVPQTTYIFEYSSTLQEKFSSTPRLYSSISHDQSTRKYSSILPTSMLDNAIPTAAVTTSFHSILQILSSTPIVENVHFSSAPPTAQIFKTDLEDSSQKDIDENNRRYQSSMHLVFSLVFGLLVLFGVLGTIAKRVYDSWIRRHYRRMDFLIDGMYDGYP